LKKEADYLITFRFEADGMVGKENVIGTLFGQLEGLWPEIDLGLLNSQEKVGWIDVEIHPMHGKTVGTVSLPLQVSPLITALIAASIETITAIGLYPVKFEVTNIIDVKATLRKQVIARAKTILRQWTQSADDALQEVSRN
jgi:DNA primase